MLQNQDFGNVPILELLLQRGATIDAIDRHGCSPLSYAKKFNHATAIKMLEAKLAEKITDINQIRDKVSNLSLELLRQINFEEAAIKIQSVFRGHRVRKQTQMDIPRSKRRSLSSKSSSKGDCCRNPDSAALKIQKAYRRHKRKKQETAAIKIQLVYRQYKENKKRKST